MIAGHLRDREGIWQIELSYYFDNGNGKKIRKAPLISTHLPVARNKRVAEQLLQNARRNFDPIKDNHKLKKEHLLDPDEYRVFCEKQQKLESLEKNQENISKDEYPDDSMPFVDYLLYWIERHRSEVSETTYYSYKTSIENTIIPYFKPLKLTIESIKKKDIYDFYHYCQFEKEKVVKRASIKHYHSYLKMALDYAVDNEMIENNIMDHVKSPGKENFRGEAYTLEEIKLLMEKIKGDPIELPIYLAILYGMRRSEILGLKWSAIDFNNKTILVKHTVVSSYQDGKTVVVQKDTTKTKSSYRPYPLIEPVESMLKELKKKQTENALLAGDEYYYGDADYILVNEMGRLFKPDYISKHYKMMLKQANLRKIRFHDLRHTCATLLLMKGNDIRDVQEWLGHSNISTTVDIYGHYSYKQKIKTGELMSEMFLK